MLFISLPSDLSNNLITNIESSVFSPLVSITTLLLYHNPPLIVVYDSFGTVSPATFIADTLPGQIGQVSASACPNTCGTMSYCYGTFAQFSSCSCYTNYYLITPTSCVFNQCHVSNGGCMHECHPPYAVCTCDIDSWLNPDDKNCHFNYCYFNNGGCQQHCNEVSGECSCEPDYDLQPDGSCVLNLC